MKIFYDVRKMREYVDDLRSKGVRVDVSRTAGVEKDEAKDGDGPIAKYVICAKE